MITEQFKFRGYQIVNHSGLIDAAAQFLYKGYQISMTTLGLSEGACQREVFIYEKNEVDNEFDNVIAECRTVEDAINFINAKSN